MKYFVFLSTIFFFVEAFCFEPNEENCDKGAAGDFEKSLLCINAGFKHSYVANPDDILTLNEEKDLKTIYDKLNKIYICTINDTANIYIFDDDEGTKNIMYVRAYKDFLDNRCCDCIKREKNHNSNNRYSQLTDNRLKKDILDCRNKNRMKDDWGQDEKEFEISYNAQLEQILLKLDEAKKFFLGLNDLKEQNKGYFKTCNSKIHNMESQDVEEQNWSCQIL